MKPQFRKVQLINDSSFAIVIPKDMAKEMNIEKGDTVRMRFIAGPHINSLIEIEKAVF